MMVSPGDCTQKDGSRRSSCNSRNPTLWKKQKVSDSEHNLDRISALPDSLLVQILSLLPTTKDALTTCVLSKRWCYLWTSIHNFIFIRRNQQPNYRGDPYDRIVTFDDTLENEKIERFVSFVDYVLAHSVSSKIIKFELDCRHLCGHGSQISRWFSFAAERKVEHVLSLSYRYTDPSTLPDSFRTCSSLITLHLRHYLFHNNVVIAWKSLKSLKLECVVINNDQILNLLIGCPALETMECYDVGGFTRLEIKSMKFKRLNLKNHRLPFGNTDHSLDIVAPYLQDFEISGKLDDLKCRLVDVSSLVNAKLAFHISCIKNIQSDRGELIDHAQDSCRDYHQGFRALVQDYLLKLSCVTELTIGSWFTEVPCMVQFKGMQIPQLKCKYLTLELHMKKFNLDGVAGLLRASPHVETLNIDMADMLQDDIPFCNFEADEDNIALQSWISTFVFPNLKNVNIVNSCGVCLREDVLWSFNRLLNKLLKLSEYLLKNATVLEKFVIISKRRKCQLRCARNCVSRYFFGLAEKLLGCPRSSPNSVIIFQL